MDYKVYILPERLRSVLSREYGILVEGFDRASTARKAIKIIGKRRVWSVGDIVTVSLIEAGFIPHVAVVDGATLREEGVDIRIVKDIYSRAGIILRISNPRGAISSEAINAIKYIAVSPQKTFLVIVNGEEDLLSLVIAGTANIGEILLYGVPRKGIAIVEIDHKIRALALDLLKDILGKDYEMFFSQ
jgi:uncharacterized protein (UPF0218 family)